MASMDITQVLKENASKERVAQIMKRYDKEVRREIEDLTRLRASYEREEGEKESLTLKPTLITGYPTSPRPSALKAREELIARLGAWRRHLKALTEASEALLALNEKEPDLLSQFDYTDPFEGALKTANEIGGKLMGEANPEALFKHVKKLATVAGRAGEPKEKSGKGQGHSVEIELYWAMLGYFSDVKAVPLENIVIYTLAHEVAHAYLRCGYDASGCPWEESAYTATDHGLREALADYYALQTLRRLESLLPDISEVFGVWHEGNNDRLRVRDVWVKEYQPELVRHVLIPIRRSGDFKTLDEFEARLDEEKPRFVVKKKVDDDLFGELQ